MGPNGGVALTGVGPAKIWKRWIEGAKRNEKSACHICACANHISPGAGNDAIGAATTSNPATACNSATACSPAARGRKSTGQCPHQPESNQRSSRIQRIHYGAEYY